MFESIQLLPFRAGEVFAAISTKTTICVEARRKQTKAWLCKELRANARIALERHLLFFVVFDPAHLGQYLRQRIGQAVDVFGGVEWSGADAHGTLGERAQRPVDVGGAVHARANGNVKGSVEHVAQVGG